MKIGDGSSLSQLVIPFSPSHNQSQDRRQQFWQRSDNSSNSSSSLSVNSSSNNRPKSIEVKNYQVPLSLLMLKQPKLGNDQRFRRGFNSYLLLRALFYSDVYSSTRRVKSEKFPRKREMDEINKLPDELVLEILERIPNAKALLMTSLVSHRFAHLVSKVRIVRVSRECFGHDAFALTAHHTPSRVQIDEEGIENIMDKLIRPYNNLPTVYCSTCLPPLSNYLSVLRFVSKLRKIQHLTIEVPSFVDDMNLLFKWTAHLEDGVLHSVSAIVKDWIVSGRIPWEGVIRDATLRSDLLVQQSYHHPNLQSFTIIDPRRRGPNTVVTGPELAKLKGGRYDSRRLCNIKKISTSFPSGVLMSYAEIVLLKFVYTGVVLVEDDGTEVSESDMEEFVSCFDHIDPEESIFQEAAEEVYKLPRDNLDSKFVLKLGCHYFFH